MPTRNVVITRQQSDLIDRLVKEGRYQNASEVLREGIRFVEDAEMKRKALNDAIELGLADSAAGRYRVFDSDEALEEHVKSQIAKGYKQGISARRGK
jgi:antitoxin ParD1/3/4